MTINRNNYEEYFLLYIDRELGQDEQLMVEDFIRLHPDLEKEFSALKQTIAVAPVMIYEGKEKLLKEKPERRVLPVYWMRIAATLIVLLAGGWFLLLITGRARNNPGSLNPSEGIALHQEAKPRNPGAANPANRHETNPDAAANPKKSFAATGEEETPAAGSNLKRTTAEDAALTKSGSRESKNPGFVTDPKSRNIVRGSARTLKNENNSGKTDPDQMENLSIENETQNQQIPKTTNDLPDIAQNSPAPGTADVLPSIVNRHPPTVLPSGIRQPESPNPPPEENPTESSVLVFNNKSKAVGGFFKKLTAKSSDADVTADNHRHRINISVFQFNLSK